MYDIRQAAKLIGLEPSTLRQYAYRGKVKSVRADDGLFFSQASLKIYRDRHPATGFHKPKVTRESWAEFFDNRYDEGSRDKLLLMLKRHAPLKEIAECFGVTTTSAKAWAVREGYNYDGPKRMADELWKELLKNETFSSFYRIVMAHIEPRDVEPVLGEYGDRFFVRTVKAKGRLMRIRKAGKIPKGKQVLARFDSNKFDIYRLRAYPFRINTRET